MTLRALRQRCLSYALALPGAWEDHPWGESVAKVGKKVFLFLGMTESAELGLSVKLGAAANLALELPFTEPTGYGLGKHGWITARFARVDDVPIDLIEEWILESHRAVAPKRVTKQPSPKAPAKGAAKTAPEKAGQKKAAKKAPAKKAPAKKAAKKSATKKVGRTKAGAK